MWYKTACLPTEGARVWSRSPGLRRLRGGDFNLEEPSSAVNLCEEVLSVFSPSALQTSLGVGTPLISISGAFTKVFVL